MKSQNKEKNDGKMVSSIIKSLVDGILGFYLYSAKIHQSMVYSEYFFYNAIYNILKTRDSKFSNYQWKYPYSKKRSDFTIINKVNKYKKKIVIEINFVKYSSNKINIINQMKIDYDKLKILSSKSYFKYIIILCSMKEKNEIYKSLGSFRKYYKAENRDIEDYIYVRWILSKGIYYTVAALRVIETEK